MTFAACVAAALALAAAVSAGSLKDVKHVVLFMQENRAFDHYFGTMAGVRGFADPNVQKNPDGRTTFQQLVSKSESSKANQLTPWYINYLGGHWFNATECYGAGSNSWEAMHEAYNKGLNNKWVAKNTPYSFGYFKRSDLPTHFDIAEAWTIGDMYQEAILAATDPNRIIWMSGTVNNPGTPNNPDGKGDMILDNSATPGCEKPHLNCFPFTWKTVPEYWQEAGVTWQVYQDADNFEDNMLAYFVQYQKADADSPLTKYGNSYIGLHKFYQDAAEGNLPEISYIIGPAELSEHPPYTHSDGAWLQRKVVESVVNSPKYNETVLIISYDEGGGFGDHVTPYYAPKDTPGEWIQDPYGLFGDTPVGPGFRIPLFIVSPWTRGGNVFTEHADHYSQIFFVEKWLQARGYSNVESKEVPPWRRSHMSDLLKAFDFDHPDTSIPSITTAPRPLRDASEDPPEDGQLGALDGNYVGAAHCQAMYKSNVPPVPYGRKNAHADPAALVEDGFKRVRGALTEGRTLVLEMGGFALAAKRGAGALGSGTATAAHDKKAQRWVAHQKGGQGSATFAFKGVAGGRWIGAGGALVKSEGDAVVFVVKDLGSGKGYTLVDAASGKALGIKGDGTVVFAKEHGEESGFDVFSVTYR